MQAGRSPCTQPALEALPGHLVQLNCTTSAGNLQLYHHLCNSVQHLCDSAQRMGNAMCILLFDGRATCGNAITRLAVPSQATL